MCRRHDIFVPEHPVRRAFIRAALLTVLFAVSGAPLHSAPPAAGKQLRKILDTSVSWSVRDVSLGQMLNDFSSQSGAAVLRHRLLNPRQPVSIDSGFVPRIRILQQTAEVIPGAVVVQTDKYVLIGPQLQTRRLPVLLLHSAQQELEWKQLPGRPIPRQATTSFPQSWQTPATPAEILRQAADRSGIQIRNLPQIPHDIWAEQQLPPLTFLELASLVLSQFDLYADADAQQPAVTIRPIAVDEEFTLRHPSQRDQRDAIQQQWKQGPQPRWSGSDAILTATIDQHADFAALSAGPNKAAGNPAVSPDSLQTRLFQLQADRARLGDVVATLRSNGIPIQITGEQTPAVNRVLQTIISLKAVSTRQPGSQFFPKIFRDHFRTVDVRPDRVLLVP
jgi:hypothetical protein